MPETVLVTGGTGYVAGWCILRLLEAGYTVRTTSYTQAGVTDETLWTDPDAAGIIPYRRSKTLAERAAWDYIEKARTNMTLTTILPGAVFGSALSPENLNS